MTGHCQCQSWQSPIVGGVQSRCVGRPLTEVTEVSVSPARGILSTGSETMAVTENARQILK